MLSMVSVESANVDAIGYNPLTLELYVQFLKTGSTYVFQPVEESRYQEFLKADSKGEYLSHEVETHYECEKF